VLLSLLVLTAVELLVILLPLMTWECIKMNKVFIVVEPIPYEGDTVLRVFGDYKDAIAYGEELVEDGTVDEFDVYEREVY
jgi:hypothetical protein